jgi:transposase
VIAISDNQGYVLSPLTIAPVNRSDSVLLPDGIKDLKRVAAGADLDLKGTMLNLDAGFDSKANRKCIFNAGMKPNIKENPRNRKTIKRGRKRFFDGALYQMRFTIERVFAWEDKFKRLVLRYETKQKRHLGFKLIAFSLINLREYCEG